VFRLGPLKVNRNNVYAIWHPFFFFEPKFLYYIMYCIKEHRGGHMECIVWSGLYNTNVGQVWLAEGDDRA
jgi:hypothetical protein